MIVRLPGSELGPVKRTVQTPAPWVELVQETGVSRVPRCSIPALVQVQVPIVFALPVPEVPLPM